MHSRGYGEVSKPYLNKALFDTQVASTECHWHTQERFQSVFAREGVQTKYIMLTWRFYSCLEYVPSPSLFPSMPLSLSPSSSSFPFHFTRFLKITKALLDYCNTLNNAEIQKYTIQNIESKG